MAYTALATNTTALALEEVNAHKRSIFFLLGPAKDTAWTAKNMWLTKYGQSMILILKFFESIDKIKLDLPIK